MVISVLFSGNNWQILTLKVTNAGKIVRLDVLLVKHNSFRQEL